MDGLVVDTDVVSFLFKNHPLARLYVPYLVGVTPIVSFMTVAELDRWALLHRWGPARRARMAQYLRRFVVQPGDRALCALWADTSVNATRAGRPIGVADAWHAATALYHGVPLLTHNRRDYAGVDGLTVISEAP